MSEDCSSSKSHTLEAATYIVQITNGLISSTGPIRAHTKGGEVNHGYLLAFFYRL